MILFCFGCSQLSLHLFLFDCLSVLLLFQCKDSYAQVRCVCLSCFSRPSPFVEMKNTLLAFFCLLFTCNDHGHVMIIAMQTDIAVK